MQIYLQFIRERQSLHFNTFLKIEMFTGHSNKMFNKIILVATLPIQHEPIVCQ